MFSQVQKLRVKTYVALKEKSLHMQLNNVGAAIYVADMPNTGSAKGLSELEKLYRHFWYPVESGRFMALYSLQRVPALHVI